MATPRTALSGFSGQSAKRFRLNEDCNGVSYEGETLASQRALGFMDYEETVTSSQAENEPGWLSNVSQVASDLLRYGSGIAAKVGSLFSWKGVNKTENMTKNVEDYDYYAMPGQKRKVNSEVSLAEQTAEPEKFVRITPPDSESEIPFSNQSVFQLPFRNATQKEALEKQMADSPSRRSLRTPRRTVRASRISTSIKSPTTSIQSAIITRLPAENRAVELEKAHDVLNTSFVEGLSSRSTPAIVAASAVAAMNNAVENAPEDLSFSKGYKESDNTASQREYINHNNQLTPELHQEPPVFPNQNSLEAEELAANSQSPSSTKQELEFVSPDSPVSTPTLEDGMDDDTNTVVASSQQETEVETETEPEIRGLQCPVSADEFAEEEEEEDDEEEDEQEDEDGEEEDVLAGHFENEELDKTLMEEDKEDQLMDQEGSEREVSYDEIVESGDGDSVEYPETSFVRKVHRKSPPVEFDGDSLALLAPSSSEVFDQQSGIDYLSQLKAFVVATPDDEELLQSLEEAFSADKAYVDLPSVHAEVPSVSSAENSPDVQSFSLDEEGFEETSSKQSQRRDKKGRFASLPLAEEEEYEDDENDEQEESFQVSDVKEIEQVDEDQEEEEDEEEDEDSDEDEIICEGVYVQPKPSPFVNRRVYVPVEDEEEDADEDQEEMDEEEEEEEEEAVDGDGIDDDNEGEEEMEGGEYTEDSVGVEDLEGEAEQDEDGDYQQE